MDNKERLQYALRRNERSLRQSEFFSKLSQHTELDQYQMHFVDLPASDVRREKAYRSYQIAKSHRNVIYIRRLSEKQFLQLTANLASLIGELPCFFEVQGFEFMGDCEMDASSLLRNASGLLHAFESFVISDVPAENGMSFNWEPPDTYDPGYEIDVWGQQWTSLHHPLTVTLPATQIYHVWPPQG